MKYILFTAIHILITGLLGYLYFHERADRKALESTISNTSTVKLPPDVQHIADVVNEKGMQTAIYEEAQKISQTEFNSVVNERDSLKKKITDQEADLKIARKQITAYQEINSTLQADNLLANRTIDSLGRLRFDYKDDNLSLTFRPDTTNNAGYFDFKYNANISITQYWHRDWFLGAKRSRIAITSFDPRITINGFKKYDILQKEPQFGLRVQGSGLINPETGSYGFGPAARIDFNRLSMQYQHLYYPQSRRWRPSFTLNYDFIRF